MLQESLALQNRQLSEAGCPDSLVVSVAEGLLRKMKTIRQGDKNDVAGVDVQKKIAVIPYIHQTSHYLKKMGKRLGVGVVFSAPLKLSVLCKKTNPCKSEEKKLCSIRHQNLFVPCEEGVVYRMPLSCGCEYIGQTSRCVNTRLKEHNKNLRDGNQGNLGLHCGNCVDKSMRRHTKPCNAEFSKSDIVYRHKDQCVREIVEAAEIACAGEGCVSMPSLTLTKEEQKFIETW